jgi:hypothetical protein
MKVMRTGFAQKWKAAATSTLLSCIAAAAVLVALFPTSWLRAQVTPISIRHSVACRECRVEFTKLATLGKPTDSVLISGSFTLDRDSRGRFYTSSDYSQVIVYDAHGNFLRTIGRPGDGPGELGRVSELIARAGFVRSPIVSVTVDKADTIFVYHPPKITVFSPNYKYVRTITLTPGVGNILHGPWRLADGSFVLGGDYRHDPALIGYSIHVATPDGRITRNLGVETQVTPQTRIPLLSELRIATDGRSIWSVYGYSFDQWRIADNAHLAKLTITDVPWLERPQAAGVPPVNIQFVGMDSSERIWSIGRLRSPSQKNSDRILELFDTRTRTVLSSQKISTFMKLFPKGDASYTLERNADGVAIVTAFSFRLVGR